MANPAPDGSFEFVDHTADIAVRLRARTPAGLFRGAASALTETVTNGGTVRPVCERTVELTAPELDLLLVDWLHELLFLFETEAFLVHDARVDITYGATKGTKDTKDTKEGGLFGNSEASSAGQLLLRELRDLSDLRGEYVIRGTVRGEPRDPKRHPLKLLIKAVTYHGLHIMETDDGYEATVILDI